MKQNELRARFRHDLCCPYVCADLLSLPSAGSHCTSARVLRLAPQRHLQQLGYVPKGCQGLTVQVSGHYGFGSVYGTVTVTNPNQFDMPIASVMVQVNNNLSAYLDASFYT
jgi:hypothetical protein